MNRRTRQGSNRSPLRHDLKPEMVPLERLKMLGRDTRKHPAEQIARLARSIEAFGVVLPILVDRHERIIAGAAVVAAARRLELRELPVVRLEELSEAEARALRLALNRIGEGASWDDAELALELGDLSRLDTELDLGLTGFDIPEVDLLLQTGEQDADETALWPAWSPRSAVRPGDCWVLGRHRLVCGDALDPATLSEAMNGQLARMVLTDPPYNLSIRRHVSGRGAGRHDEFAMASGEMTPEAFTAFLLRALTAMKAHLVNGGLIYSFMDWRHMGEMLAAARSAGLDMVNLVVWVKSNGGLGSLYRSRHELVFVLKAGNAGHVNNVLLGRHGRNRSNVWAHAGATAFGRARELLLRLHPTTKPVALLMDAVLDATRRGDLVLDPFLGSGSTLLAAERTGRVCHAIEIAPQYCDAVLARWQTMTGVEPALAETGEGLGAVLARRGMTPATDSAETTNDA